MQSLITHNRMYKQLWQHDYAAILLAEGFSIQRALEKAGWGRTAHLGLQAIMRSGPLQRAIVAHGILLENLRYQHSWICKADTCAKWNYHRGAECKHCGYVDDVVYVRQRKQRSRPSPRMMRTPELLRKLATCAESEQLSRDRE